MNEVRAIKNVPTEKLGDVVADLKLEVGENNVRVSPQSDGKWLVEYLVESIGAHYDNPSGSFATSGSNAPSFFKRNL